MVDEIPQDFALRAQLTMFAGGKPDGLFLEVRYRRPGATVRRLGFFDAAKLDGICGEIERVAAFADTWVGAAPRDREDGTARGVSRVACLWIDVDGRNALERLAAFRPLPSLVVRSGSENCAHAYWPLKAAVSPYAAQRACRRLARALAGDMNACDPTRILRPAGTRNFKHEPPAPVVCSRLEFDAFTIDEVVGGLPDSDHYKPRPVVAHACNDPSRLLAGISRTVAEAQEGNRNASLYWAVCRVAEHETDFDTPAALGELRAAAAHAGLGAGEIEQTIRSGLATGSKVAA